MVWNDKITKPVSIRYAWADNPDDINLYTVDGLPVTPFQIEVKKKGNAKAPIYKNHEIEGSSVKLYFQHIGKGLTGISQ